MDYYYLATALPDIQIGIPLEISFEGLEILLKENLIHSDWLKVRVIRRYYDLKNIRLFWQDEPLNMYGNYDSGELEEILVSRIGFPAYVFDFIDRYDHVETRLNNFPELLSAYFQVEMEQAKGFLQQYLRFEREVRLVFAAFRAKKLGRDLTLELQFESPSDDLVMQMIAQKDTKSYSPPYRYSDLKPIFDSYQDHPLDLHKALCEYRFAKIDEMIGVDLFSIEKVLGFMVQLMIAERWQKLDKEKGVQVVDTIIKEASK